MLSDARHLFLIIPVQQVAKSLYHAFRSDQCRQYLEPLDFYPAYATHEAAEEAFKVFDKDGNGDISRAEIKTKVLQVYKVLIHQETLQSQAKEEWLSGTPFP
jgi:hypothetical protein